MLPDVSLEGTLVLDDFDIYVAAGNAKLTAVDRSFAVTVTDSLLNVTFGRVLDNPLISAIEVVWAGSSPATPLVTYTYRGDGQRNSKTVTTTATTTYTWDLNSSLPVVLQDGTYSYVYGLGGLISETDGSGNQSYFLGNGLGSTEKLTDGSGNVITSYKYDIFGAVRSSSGSGSTEYRFNGQQDDATLGYTYLRARYYDPATGRFLSKDPFPGVLTNPASQHYYGYTGNNPANWNDPSGLTWDTNFNFLVEFLFGAGDSERFYGQDDIETIEMRYSRGASALREAFCSGGYVSVYGVDYSTIRAAMDTLPNPFGWFSTAVQVGGFAGASALNNGNGTVTFTIVNYVGLESFAYHMLPDRTENSGPMRTIKQTFQWTETISSGW